jgi:MtN3 and saliva related transmembrane protein
VSVTLAERTVYGYGGATVPTALGVAAATWGFMMALSPLLQVREIRRRGSSEGVSVGYFGVLEVGFALWVAYGLASGDVPLVVPNVVAFIVTAFTIIVVLGRRR